MPILLKYYNDKKKVKKKPQKMKFSPIPERITFISLLPFRFSIACSFFPPGSPRAAKEKKTDLPLICWHFIWFDFFPEKKKIPSFRMLRNEPWMNCKFQRMTIFRINDRNIRNIIFHGYEKIYIYIYQSTDASSEAPAELHYIDISIWNILTREGFLENIQYSWISNAFNHYSPLV